MEKRIFELTVTEFLELLAANQPAPQFVTPQPESRKLYSMKQLAEFLQCSTVTAQKLKNSGKIPYVQTGRKLIFDSEAVINSLAKRKGQKV